MTTNKKVNRQFNISVPLPEAAVNEDTTVANMVENATKNKNLGLQMLIDNLNLVENNLSRNVATTPQESVKHMLSLFRVLLGVINNDKTQTSFYEQWSYVLKFFKEKQSDGLGAHRIFRGISFWGLGHDEFKLFQSLTNLIEVSNRLGIQECRPFVNFSKIIKDPISDAGRGRLLSYYN